MGDQPRKRSFSRSAETGEPTVAYDWTTDENPGRPRGSRPGVGDPGTNLRIVIPDRGSGRHRRLDDEKQPPEFGSWWGAAGSKATVFGEQAGQQDPFDDSDAPTDPPVDRLVLGDLIDEFRQAAENGVALDLWGAPYQGEGLRTLKDALSRIDAELGEMSVHAVRRAHVQQLVSDLRSAGVAPARISALVDTLTALYSFAIRRDLVGFSPVVELDLRDTERVSPSMGLQTGFPPPNAAGPGTPAPFSPPVEGWAPPPVAPPSAGWTPPPFSPPAAGWTPPPGVPPGAGWTPPPFSPPAAGWTPPPYAAQNYSSGGFVPPQQPFPNGSGPLSGMLRDPTVSDGNYDATMQERWLWWTVRIIVIVFVLIALVLVAESV
jgi:hypothetical protein